MVDFFRTGQPIADRPDRYRLAIERLTAQDIAVFFQEALAALPQLVADLSRGGRVVDVHCGGGRWLVAMARRFPELELVGVEFEADSVAAGAGDRRGRRAGRPDRDPPGRRHRAGQGGRLRPGLLPVRAAPAARRAAALRAAWEALRPGGRLLVLDWPLPAERDEFRTRHGELIAGVQLDELYQGTALVTRERFLAWFDGGRAAAPDRRSTCRPAPRCSSSRSTDRPPSPRGAAAAGSLLASSDGVISIVPVIEEWTVQWNGYVPAAVNVRPSRLRRLDRRGARSRRCRGSPLCDSKSSFVKAITSPTLASIAAGLNAKSSIETTPRPDPGSRRRSTDPGCRSRSPATPRPTARRRRSARSVGGPDATPAEGRADAPTTVRPPSSSRPRSRASRRCTRPGCGGTSGPPRLLDRSRRRVRRRRYGAHGRYGFSMTSQPAVRRTQPIDAPTMRRLLRPRGRVHAVPGRELRDLGDAILLHRPDRPGAVLEPAGGHPLAGRAGRVRSAPDRGRWSCSRRSAASRTSGRRRRTTRRPTSSRGSSPTASRTSAPAT